jgi:hypothetical protein
MKYTLLFIFLFGMAHANLEAFDKEGRFKEVKFEYGTPKVMRVLTEDGNLSEQKGWIDKKIIERIVGWSRR